LDERFNATVARWVRASPLEPQATQSQRVADDRDGAQTHRRGGEHGAKQQAESGIENAGCDRYAQDVVDEGKEEPLLDAIARAIAPST